MTTTDLKAGLTGYAGVKDAEVNKSLPTQGGGAGDRETVQRLVMAELWASEQYNGVGPDYDSYRINGKHPMGGRVEAYEKRAKKLTDAILSALQAAPSEGGEPVAWVWEDDIGDRHSTTRKDMADHLIMNGVDVQPAYARPPAPSEEPLVGDWKSANKSLAHLAADERDRCIALSGLLARSREYVSDCLEAHEHSDGRELLTEIDAMLAAAPAPDAQGEPK